MLFLLLVSTLTAAFNIQPAKAESGTIYIRADGSIDPPGAPIVTYDYVTYTLTDSITSSADGIVVERDNIVIDGAGYTLQGAGSGYGIDLSDRRNVTVMNTIIKAFGYGIHLYNSYENVIRENILSNNFIGIILCGGGNTISSNIVTNNSYNGIELASSGYNTISDNTITHNGLGGIDLGSSGHNTLSGNVMVSNGYNFGVHGATVSDYSNYVDTSNTVDGKPIYYWVNEQNKAIPSDAGCVIIVESKNITVKDLTLTRNMAGVLLAYTQNSTVQNVISENNYHYGIELYGSHNNTLINNTAADNAIGIFLQISNWNVLSGNIVMNNSEEGIGLHTSSENVVRENIILENGYGGVSPIYYKGIWLSESSGNKIYHNSFINNQGGQVYVKSGYTNVWDDGYPSGGNYWSDHTSVDLYSGPYQNKTGSDGIWDRPYIIDANNKDRYPLVNPWTPTHIWPMFQHDPQRTGRSPYVGPKSREPELRIFSPEGYSNFGPVAIDADGTIYSRANTTRGTGLYAFNPDGTEKWFLNVSVGGHPTIGPDGTIYMKSIKGIIAVDSYGTVKWEKGIAIEYTRQQFVIGDEGILYFVAGVVLPNGSLAAPCLVALDVNGEVVWLYDIKGNQTWYVGSDYDMAPEGCVGSTDTDEVTSPSIGLDGTVYLGYRNVLFAINADGTKKWQSEVAPEWQGPFGPVIPTITSVISSNGMIYVAVNSVDWGRDLQISALYAISPDGNVAWMTTFAERFSGPPVIGPDGTIYLFISCYSYAWYRTLYYLRAYDMYGENKWGVQVGWEEWGLSNLIVDNAGNIFIVSGTYGKLTGFSSNGEQLWILGVIGVGLALNRDGTLLVPASKLYAVRDFPQVPPSVPSQPRNISPPDGATNVSLEPQLLSSPPLQDVDIESIPWEEINGLWVTRVDSQWQITAIQGDYSNPVWNETLTDGLIDRRFFPSLPDTWANWVPAGVLDYETKYYWRVRYMDFRGVWSPWSEETSFTTRKFIPPKADFDYSPKSPKAGEKVELDASASFPGETLSISYYRWDLDGDGAFDGLTTSPIIYYRWDKSDTYKVTLEVVNSAGDRNLTTKEITVERNPEWEGLMGAIRKRIFGPKGPTEEDWKRFEIIKRELHLEEFDEFYDSTTPAWVRDMQILMALKEKIPTEEGEITYEEYILQVLHDMALVDSYVNYPWGAQPQINEYFTNMAEVSKWAELTLILAARTLPVAEGIILMIPKVVQAGISLEFLYKTLYERERWFFFNDLYDQGLLSLNAAQRDHLQALKDEYAEPLRTRGEEFKQEVREKLRSFLYNVLEKYKFLPVQAYQKKSPVELRVYDSHGNVTGLLNGMVNEGIMGSAYFDGTILIYPALDTYYFTMTGTSQGAYGVTAISVKEGEVLNFTAIDIPISTNATHQYTIDWTALSLGEKGVTVMVDSDGDGVFEHTFTSDSELTHDEFIQQTTPTYNLTITATIGGTTNPSPGMYTYIANSTVQVTAIPEANYIFDHWELDTVNVGSANPYTVLMDNNHTLKAVFTYSPPSPPLSASINPLSASMLVGQSVTFTSTVSGGYTPYSYQWYLNGNPVSGATSSSWTFTPTTGGIYYVHLKVIDAEGNTAQSDTARIVVSTVPVGGYSIPIQLPTTAKPVTLHIALLTILTALFITIKRKTKRKH